eukprot:4197667-Prorocentrum_lima.AAC.1
MSARPRAVLHGAMGSNVGNLNRNAKAKVTAASCISRCLPVGAEEPILCLCSGRAAFGDPALG